MSAFIHRFLETKYAVLRAAASAGGSTKAALTCGFLKSFHIAFPEPDEQAEIVAMLDPVDAKVAAAQGKLNTLNELFRTLLHQLMTAQLRVTDLDLSDLPDRA